MKILKNILFYILVTPIFLFFVGFSLTTESNCPDKTLIFVNENTKEYFAPPCLMKSGFDNIDQINKYAKDHNLKVYLDKQITGKGLYPNPECREGKGFTQDGRSFSGEILEKIGLLPKLKTRWNADGTWNK